jgi:hypothetical protein
VVVEIRIGVEKGSEQLQVYSHNGSVRGRALDVPVSDVCSACAGAKPRSR